MKSNRMKYKLHNLVLKGEYENLIKLIDKGYKIYERNDYLQTIIHVIAKESIKFIVSDGNKIKFTSGIKKLVKLGAAVNFDDLGGYTPLHYAIINNNLSAAATLIHCGAHLDSLDHSDRSPLHYAVESKNLKAVTLLTNHGADPNISHLEQNPIKLAIDKKCHRILIKLIESGGNLKDVAKLYFWNGIDYGDYTHFRYAAVKKRYKMLDILMQYSVPSDDNFIADLNQFSKTDYKLITQKHNFFKLIKSFNLNDQVVSLACLESLQNGLSTFEDLKKVFNSHIANIGGMKGGNLEKQLTNYQSCYKEIEVVNQKYFMGSTIELCRRNIMHNYIAQVIDLRVKLSLVCKNFAHNMFLILNVPSEICVTILSLWPGLAYQDSPLMIKILKGCEKFIVKFEEQKNYTKTKLIYDISNSLGDSKSKRIT